MAGSGFQVSVHNAGAPRFKDLAKALRKSGRGDLRTAMNKSIRTAGRPALNDVRRAALALPDVSSAKRRDNQSIRRMISKATRLQVRVSGIRIVVDRTKLPADSSMLPQAFESRKGWRHRVFGTDTWVHQPGHPWFRKTLKRHEQDFRRAIEKAMDEAAAQMER